jgi:tetraacyldisaccharide 4'-kinase
MTEKDAVKCQAFAPDNAWFLEVDADVEPGLQQLLLERLKAWHGRETA